MPVSTMFPSRGTARGVTLILAATAIAGASGYAMLAVIAANKQPADYVSFSVFWSTLYLVISALSGVQQEIARGTRPRATSVASPSRRFAIVCSLGIAGLVLLTAPLWVGVVFPTEGWHLVVPLAIGAASYISVAVLCGTMYGLGLWRAVSFMVSIDALLRLTCVSVLLVFTTDTTALAWGIVLPFPVTPLLLWLFVRRSIVGRSVLDVGYRTLTWNVAHTVVAATATGVLVSGYPLIIKAASPQIEDAALGPLLFAITLVRAPLIIVFLSLQSFLVVFFRGKSNRAESSFAVLTAAVIVVTAIFSVAAWLIGPFALSIFGSGYAVSSAVLAGLVATSGVLALLCISGPLALARSHHGIFTAGWLVAAALSVLALFLPTDLASRMLLSLAIGPLVGVLVHLIGIRVRRSQRGKNGTGTRVGRTSKQNNDCAR